ncbi:phage tail assembly protein [Arcobacter cryaerophilus gv. pseudocryaerophilus]|uniref:Phage tail assembly protein n=3 Tax=unclassified Arcobacter TaxID=2593671 RepID=A0AA96DHQ1_9BACT|nr:phage tail assembly protein [Arcobacter sp. AZ-2023]WPD04721.1 phage tail assembly protein [Arcobacter sp. DSM 115956]WPD06816.1 phage tail assembly protein [Arcobacter sp. DSM 115955]WNL31081.1 phage tail assembly protein [Arcobacter sp. AZ-2023]WNP37231.1 phage tail assembly protein [Arcobacter sp. AZ-2023]
MAKTIENKKVAAYLGDAKLELSTPLIVGGKDIEEIVIKEPLLEDLEAVSHIHNDLERTAMLIANKSGFTYEEIRKFPTHIYMKLQGLVEPFLR